MRVFRKPITGAWITDYYLAAFEVRGPEIHNDITERQRYHSMRCLTDIKTIRTFLKPPGGGISCTGGRLLGLRLIIETRRTRETTRVVVHVASYPWLRLFVTWIFDRKPFAKHTNKKTVH
jgi:hypothetical protein